MLTHYKIFSIQYDLVRLCDTYKGTFDDFSQGQISMHSSICRDKQSILLCSGDSNYIDTCINVFRYLSKLYEYTTPLYLQKGYKYLNYRIYDEIQCKMCNNYTRLKLYQMLKKIYGDLLEYNT